MLTHFAERSIDVQYYLYHDDLVGVLFTHQLLKAADRGVRVRLLVDDVDLEGRDGGVAALDAHPNMEVRIFNPFGVCTNLFGIYKFNRLWRNLAMDSGRVCRRAANASAARFRGDAAPG